MPLMMFSLLLDKCMYLMCQCSVMGRFSVHEGNLLNLSGKTMSLQGLYHMV